MLFFTTLSIRLLGALALLAVLTLPCLGANGASEKSVPASQNSTKANLIKPIADIHKKAIAGDAAAQYELGLAYLFGKGVAKDLDEAAKWLKMSALQGNAEAQLMIGTMYSAGDGVPQNLTDALVWLQKAYAQGNTRAKEMLGILYFRGCEVYGRGEGVPKDMNIAMEWCTKAADVGHSQGQYTLGFSYLEGSGVPKNVQKAVELLQKSAEQGYADAQSQLGLMYAEGIVIAKDISKAVDWISKSAAQGHANAQSNLCLMYNRGDGVPKDITLAAEWCEKAASQGHANAQRDLGLAYLRGQGVAKDSYKAAKWLQLSGAQGNASAQYVLSLMYVVGNGVPTDYVLSYAWANLAAIKGNETAVKQRNSVEQLLSLEQKAEGQRISSNWKQGFILSREGQKSVSRNDAPSTGILNKKGTGTAFVVSMMGQAITNYHVIRECRDIRAEGRPGSINVVTSDTKNDLALLQLSETINSSASIASEPTKLRQGEDIVVFGFPLNSMLSSGGNLTPGVVSALTGLGNNTNEIQTTAPIQPGSSGSPVLNMRGEVIGVVTSKLSDSELAKATGQVGQNVNFAVNGQTLKSFLDNSKVKYRANANASFARGRNSAADLADEARRWTLVVECWK